MLVIKKEQQECRSSLAQKNLCPLHIKEEHKELCSSEAGQFLDGSEKPHFPMVLVEGESQEEQQHSSPDILNVTDRVCMILYYY